MSEAPAPPGKEESAPPAATHRVKPSRSAATVHREAACSSPTGAKGHLSSSPVSHITMPPSLLRRAGYAAFFTEAGHRVTPRVSKPHDYANHMFMRL
jgi:hypothetical protein